MESQLAATFRRLVHSPLFWGLTLGMVGIGFVMLARTSGAGEPIAESSAYMGPAIVWLAALIFVSGFEGEEFSDGAIRNKLVTGSSRTSVYYALLFTSITATLVFLGAFLLPFLTVGNWTGIVDASAQHLPAFFRLLLLSILCTVATACLYHLVAMASPGKMPIVLFAVSIGLFVAGFMLLIGLQEPEYAEEWWNDIGEVAVVPNPHYIAGAARPLCEALLQLIPAGDAIALTVKEQIMQNAADGGNTFVTNMRGLTDYPLMPAYLATTSVATCLIGNVVFRRRDLR